MALAIDGRALTDAVSQGLSAFNNSPVPLPSPYHTKVQDQGFPVAPADAAKLIAEVGYKGQTVKLVTNKRYPQMFDAAVLVQAMAAAVGIKIELEVMDWAAQLERYNKGDYQMMTFAYSARLDPALNFDAFMGSKALQPRKLYDDPAAQAVLAGAMIEADPAKRQVAFDDLHQRVIRDVPLIIFYNSTHVSATRASVIGFEPWVTIQQRLWGVTLR